MAVVGRSTQDRTHLRKGGVEKEPLLATNLTTSTSTLLELEPNRRRNSRSEARDLKGHGSLAVCSRKKTEPGRTEEDERVEVE
jgi:hypothetical protein|uniref:Uncharacterized protein n=1 Tax=Zea mays TaxID=4577 RepID=C4J5R3_MAIZE|nr:unknown [Zea mays]